MPSRHGSVFTRSSAHIVPKIDGYGTTDSHKINQAVYRYGSVHLQEEILALYVDALYHMFQSVVACYGDSHRGAP